MLTDILRTLVYEIFIENFYEKQKKKKLIFLPNFLFIFYKSSIKTLINLFINKCSQGTC